MKRSNAISAQLAKLKYASAPVFALDMYEHSYHLDYGAKAAAYVDAFMQNIDWSRVRERLAQCLQPTKTSRPLQGEG